MGCGSAAERTGDEGPAAGEGDGGEAALDAGTCPAAPDLVVPLQTAVNDAAVHWPLIKGCVDVTHTAAVDPFLSKIADALAAWSSVACSRLCFEAPHLVADGHEGARHELRFTAGEGPTTAQPKFDGPSGVIIWGKVHIGVDAPPSGRALITVIGLTLGLNRPTDAAVDSVMHATAAAGAPTDNDAASLCVLYGSPAYCE